MVYLTLLVSSLLPVAFGANGAWKIATPLPWGRSDLTATSIGPNIYLAGGCDGAQKCSGDYCTCSSYTNDFTAYNPATDKYTSVVPMPRPRYRHLACPLGDDAVLMMGGRTITPDFTTSDAIITPMDSFNATTGNWTTLTTTYPTSVLGSDNSCSNFGATIYVFGGYNRDYTVSYSSTYSFTITPGTKGLEGVFKALTPMPLPLGLGDFSSVALPASLPTLPAATIHVYGGYNANATDTSWFCVPLTTHLVYTPSTNTWASGTPMPRALAEKDDGVVVGGKIFSVGGESKRKASGCIDTDIVALRDVWSWDPAAPGAWGNETWLPASVMRFASAPVTLHTMSASGAHTIKTYLYVFGGQKDLINGDTLPLSSIVYVYDPSPTPTPSPTPAPSSGGSGSGAPTFSSGILATGIVVTFVLTCLLFFCLYRTELLKCCCGCRRGGPNKDLLSSGSSSSSSHVELAEGGNNA